MPESPACVKCGSREPIIDARVIDRSEAGDQDLHLRVDGEPSALIFKASGHSNLTARVCVRCGYTEFYAATPANLLAAWRRARESGKE